MRITICASVDFAPEIKEVADQLVALGHTAEIPEYAEKISRGDLTLAEFKAVKDQAGDIKFRLEAEREGKDLIRRHFNLVQAADAILVLNLTKKGVENYIGGNTFLEMGFAYTMGKPIYLYNPIPEMGYRDELQVMRPLVLNGNFSLIGKTPTLA